MGDIPGAAPDLSVFDRRLAVLVATIAVVAAVLGALAGGTATYLGNRALEKGKSRDAARGAARVLQSRLGSARFRFELMLKQDRLLAVDDALRISLPLEDSKLIATNLNVAQWATVADSLAGLGIFATRDDRDARRASAGLVVRLDPDYRDLLRDTLAGVQRAYVALEPLAGRD